MKTLITTTLLLVMLSGQAYSQHLSQTVSGTVLNPDTKSLLTDVLLIQNTKTKSRVIQENKVWRVGFQLGNCGNASKYSGGSQIANGRFNQKTFGAPNINIVARYDLNKHWMLLPGIGLNAIGFGYSISENYSLLSIKKQVSDIQTIFPTLEVPVSLFYKFNLNCKNTRWVVGAGFVTTLGARQTSDKNFSITAEGTSTHYLSSHSVSNGGAFMLVRWSVGREKIYRNGSILQASLLVNMGFNTMATSTVHYTLDNQSYSHTFLPMTAVPLVSGWLIF